MRANLRNQIARLCKDRSTAFTPKFGAPVALEFGAEGSAGTAPTFARSDHQHGLPARPDPLVDTLFETAYISDEFNRRANELSGGGIMLYSFNNPIVATPSITGVDGDGKQYKFGGFAHTRTAAVNTSFGLFASTFTGSATNRGDTTAQEHEYRRLLRLDLQVRFGGTAVDWDAGAVPEFNTLYVGMLRTTTLNDFSALESGIFFRKPASPSPTSGDRNWRGVCKDGSHEFEVNLGVKIPGTLPYQLFRIDLTETDDGPCVDFYIDGELCGTIENENATPDLGDKACGFGAFADVSLNPSLDPFMIAIGAVRIQAKREL